MYIPTNGKHKVPLSGIEYKILYLAFRFCGYSVTIDGPWYFKLLYDLGILQIYINRLVNKGLIEEVIVCTTYKITREGIIAIIKDATERGLHLGELLR